MSGNFAWLIRPLSHSLACTRSQLLRYLGDVESDEALARLADEAAEAWGHTLGLAPLAIGG